MEAQVQYDAFKQAFEKAFRELDCASVKLIQLLYLLSRDK